MQNALTPAAHARMVKLLLGDAPVQLHLAKALGDGEDEQARATDALVRNHPLEADFTGYQAIVMQAANWRALQSEKGVLAHPEVTFRSSADQQSPQTIVGYYLSGPAGVLAAVPVKLGQVRWAGDEILVTAEVDTKPKG